MGLEGGPGQEAGERPVGQQRDQLAMHRARRAQPQAVAPAGDAAQAEARAGDAGQAGAVDDLVRGVEGLQRAAALGAAVQLAHHVELDDGDAMRLQQRHQRLLVGVVHGAGRRGEQAQVDHAGGGPLARQPGRQRVARRRQGQLDGLKVQRRHDLQHPQ
ncbi:hypothetical protein [Roseateles sp.]|uniref:hypothetical protein n=1 Tax=Roseateles sp. TaxID=1971397 RepID=UPI003BA95D0C